MHARPKADRENRISEPAVLERPVRRSAPAVDYSRRVQTLHLTCGSPLPEQLATEIELVYLCLFLQFALRLNPVRDRIAGHAQA